MLARLFLDHGGVLVEGGSVFRALFRSIVKLLLQVEVVLCALIYVMASNYLLDIPSARKRVRSFKSSQINRLTELLLLAQV